MSCPYIDGGVQYFLVLVEPVFQDNHDYFAVYNDFDIIQRIVAQLKTFSTFQQETIPCDLLLLQWRTGIRVTDLHTHGVTT